MFLLNVPQPRRETSRIERPLAAGLKKSAAGHQWGGEDILGHLLADKRLS